MLQMQVKSAVPGMCFLDVVLQETLASDQSSPFFLASATDLAEQPAMLELQETYGKTIHTWAFDIYPDLPLGPPHLMMSYTEDGQGPPPEMLKSRDEKCGMDTEAKKKLRAGYLPPYEKDDGADEWEKSGKGISFETVAKDIII